MAKPSIYQTALSNFDKAAKIVRSHVDPELLDKIRQPHERIEISLVPSLDDGKMQVFKAYIVRHSEALGPAKGGIRMTPGVTIDDVTGLAMEMTWKCALIGVPFGGGKSGIVADADKLSGFNKETLVRSFARNASRHIGPQVYVPAPDMGTNENDMGHLKDAICFSAGQATTQGCYVTGKPVILGGIPGRREATGLGVAITTTQALGNLGINIKGATAVIQGFGNVGSVAAKALFDAGVKILAVGDLYGSVQNEKGLDIDLLTKHALENGTVKDFPGADAIDSQELLVVPCDVLIPAAGAGAITEENAPDVSARIIGEGANSPTTPDADSILHERGIFVIPDILCNAGGVFVSYLEYTQETQQEQMTQAEVSSRLEERMIQKFTQVYQLANQEKLQMRDAAMSLALRTVCHALVARGYLP